MKPMEPILQQEIVKSDKYIHQIKWDKNYVVFEWKQFRSIPREELSELDNTHK